MRPVGLFSHPVVPRENGDMQPGLTFFGEHVMTDDNAPACGAHATLVAPANVTGGGFALLCRACLRNLLQAARPPRTRKETP
jgi:hypothetical protein